MKLKCYDCGSLMEPKLLGQYPRSRQKIGLIVFEDVPCLECPKCGKKYFTVEVSERMEEVLDGRLAPTGKVETATFSLKGRAA
jgi:YgiT-type zinc finger domain-containing protein